MSGELKLRQQQQWNKKAAAFADGEADARRPVLQRTQPKVNQKIPSRLFLKCPPDLKKSQSKDSNAVNRVRKDSTQAVSNNTFNGLESSDGIDSKQRSQTSGKSIEKDIVGSLCSSLLEDASGGLEAHASCSSAGSLTEQELLDGLSLASTAETKVNALPATVLARRRSKTSTPTPGASKAGKVVPEGIASSTLCVPTKKRCGWITSQSDPTYVAHHDNEWGVPVHDDKLLFELLILSGVLAELSWPTILKKRQEFRAAFSGFDPMAVACFDEKKITSLREQGIVQHESKILDIVNNAKRCLEVCRGSGSLDQYFWNFVNHKPICTKYRSSAQVPVKTPKSELMSRDLIRRGFRFVGPTIMYSFMQVTGMTNDHTVQCFRHGECLELVQQPLKKSYNNDDSN
ncbi:hypothetical protein O6H91_11G018300 [Diphasiastrum complanatum]|uniref:Uncharacterized protein n=1 Tax=Diphasiastrum complanatum TaxID=34168 RepID=A0ACC2C6P9_DIPCM|nr:hypothetical protein O6H91_11G018300 [Diphasiastrum complanatum]